jgi:hypothetical protein
VDSSKDAWDRAFGPKTPAVLQKLLEGIRWRVDSREATAAEAVAVSLDREGKTAFRALRLPAQGGGWAFVMTSSHH